MLDFLLDHDYILLRGEEQTGSTLFVSKGFSGKGKLVFGHCTFSLFPALHEDIDIVILPGELQSQWKGEIQEDALRDSSIKKIGSDRCELLCLRENSAVRMEAMLADMDIPIELIEPEHLAGPFGLHIFSLSVAEALSAVNHELFDLCELLYTKLSSLADNYFNETLVTWKKDMIQDFFAFVPLFVSQVIEYLRCYSSDHSERLTTYTFSLASKWMLFTGRVLKETPVGHDDVELIQAMNAIEYCFKVLGADELGIIYELPEDAFVAIARGCGASLSEIKEHFDLHGSRARMRNRALLAEQTTFNTTTSGVSLVNEDVTLGSEDLVMPKAVTARRMQSINELEKTVRETVAESRLSGAVLSNADLMEKDITEFARLGANIPLRWQIGRLLGGGSSGSVSFTDCITCFSLSKGLLGYEPRNR